MKQPTDWIIGGMALALSGMLVVLADLPRDFRLMLKMVAGIFRLFP